MGSKVLNVTFLLTLKKNIDLKSFFQKLYVKQVDSGDICLNDFLSKRILSQKAKSETNHKCFCLYFLRVCSFKNYNFMFTYFKFRYQRPSITTLTEMKLFSNKILLTNLLTNLKHNKVKLYKKSSNN